MEATSHLHALAALPQKKKKNPAQVEWEVGWIPVWTFGEEGNLCSCQDLNMGLSSPQSTAILTDVSQLKLQHTQTLNFKLFVTFLGVCSTFSANFQFEKYTYSTTHHYLSSV